MQIRLLPALPRIRLNQRLKTMVIEGLPRPGPESSPRPAAAPWVEEICERVAPRVAPLEGIKAVALGGSRARGTARGASNLAPEPTTGGGILQWIYLPLVHGPNHPYFSCTLANASVRMSFRAR